MLGQEIDHDLANCRAICGDGLVLGENECDDGNQVDGDGCSSTCKIEFGYECGNGTACVERVAPRLMIKNIIDSMFVTLVFTENVIISDSEALQSGSYGLSVSGPNAPYRMAHTVYFEKDIYGNTQLGVNSTVNEFIIRIMYSETHVLGDGSELLTITFPNGFRDAEGNVLATKELS